jgi:colicin import membrane protein
MRLAHATDAADNLRPRRPAGLGRGAVLALLVHGGLLLALAVGVSWRASEPTGATAELWAAVPEFAAPAAVVPPPPPPPQPVARAEPQPEPKAEPAPSRDAEIAVEKARRERERELERERERERQAKAKAEAEAEKKRQQALQEEQRKKLAEKAAREEKAEQERLAKLREDNLKRMQGQAGATGGPTATGTAARDAGPSASYAGRIIAKVRPNIVMTEAVTGSPRAEVEVRAAPDGTIVGRRLVKSSGNKDWDEAVLRALDRTEVLPRDTDGRVPSPITIGFTP